MENDSKELDAIHKVVGEQVHEASYSKALQMVRDLGSPALVDGSVPFEVWTGIAQAIADASGYRVCFEAAVMQREQDDPSGFRILGYDRFATFDPTLFHKPKPAEWKCLSEDRDNL